MAQRRGVGSWTINRVAYPTDRCIWRGSRARSVEQMDSVAGMEQRTADGTHDLSLAELAELGESRATRPCRPAAALCAHSGVQGSQSPRGSVASAPTLVRDARARALAPARHGVACTEQPGHAVATSRSIRSISRLVGGTGIPSLAAASR